MTKEETAKDRLKKIYELRMYVDYIENHVAGTFSIFLMNYIDHLKEERDYFRDGYDSLKKQNEKVEEQLTKIQSCFSDPSLVDLDDIFG